MRNSSLGRVRSLQRSARRRRLHRVGRVQSTRLEEDIQRHAQARVCLRRQRNPPPQVTIICNYNRTKLGSVTYCPLVSASRPSARKSAQNWKTSTYKATQSSHPANASYLREPFLVIYSSLISTPLPSAIFRVLSFPSDYWLLLSTTPKLNQYMLNNKNYIYMDNHELFTD